MSEDQLGGASGGPPALLHTSLLYQRLEALGLSGHVRCWFLRKLDGSAGALVVDDRSAFLKALRATGRFCEDSSRGSMLHGGHRSFREMATGSGRRPWRTPLPRPRTTLCLLRRHTGPGSLWNRSDARSSRSASSASCPSQFRRDGPLHVPRMWRERSGEPGTLDARLSSSTTVWSLWRPRCGVPTHPDP